MKVSSNVVLLSLIYLILSFIPIFSVDFSMYCSLASLVLAMGAVILKHIEDLTDKIDIIINKI